MKGYLVDSVDYRDGSVILTESHLLFLRPDGSVRNSFALKHITQANVKFEHSFRNRILGLGCAIVLLAVGMGFLVGLFWVVINGDAAYLTKKEIFALGGGGSMFVCALKLIMEVIRSRQVQWLYFRYAGVQRRIDLPDVSGAELDRIVELLP